MARMKQLIAWWQSLPLPWRPWRIVGAVGAGDEVPQQLPHRGVVLVGSGALGQATWAVFDCPCGTGHRIMVNLVRARRPFWRIESPRPLSIYPSIDIITAEGRCHFVIHYGKLRWAEKPGERNR